MVIVLVYDVIIMLGILLLFYIEIDLIIVVLLMLVIGYLFNDSIVVLDCICENFCKICCGMFYEIFNVFLI